MAALLDPVIVEQHPAVPLAPRISDLRGKRLGLVDNSKVNADLFLAHLSDALVDRFGAIVHRKVRKLAPKDHLAETDIGNLVECDAVVQCFGDCGTSTSISVADAVELERRGLVVDE